MPPWNDSQSIISEHLGILETLKRILEVKTIFYINTKDSFAFLIVLTFALREWKQSQVKWLG